MAVVELSDILTATGKILVKGMVEAGESGEDSLAALGKIIISGGMSAPEYVYDPASEYIETGYVDSGYYEPPPDGQDIMISRGKARRVNKSSMLMLFL
jgi:hypothetical protein